MTNPVGRLLIVDDERAQMKALCDTLELEGYSTLGFTSATAALAHLRQHPTFDLVLTDLTMPEMDGVHFLRAASAIDPNLVGIVMTGNGSIDTAVRAMQAGALDYILKPFKLNAVLPVLVRCLAVQRLRVENAELLAERKRSEDRLRESERQLRVLADAMPQIVWTARPDGALDFLNQRWYEFIGDTTAENGLEAGVKPVLHSEDLEQCRDVWRSAVTTGSKFEIQCRFWDAKTSDFRWHLGRAVPLHDEGGTLTKWVGTYTDIDDHKRLSEELERRVADRTAELQHLLREKTALLKEVHHRVRNNLQVISSLLARQADASEASVAEPLQSAYDRVFSMSLVHDQLYQSNNFSDIDFAEYIDLSATRLFEAYQVRPSQISLQLRLETVHLSVDLAIPCGLILNELLSNAIKHAFNDGKHGTIDITLRRLENSQVELTVADDGIGLSADFRLPEAKSLGFTVIRLLAAQFGAEVSVTVVGGTAFTLCWHVADAPETAPASPAAKSSASGSFTSVSAGHS